jgi:hypothetical protein
MSQDVPDEKLLGVEMNRGDEPVFVATDVEHVKAFPAGIHIVNAFEGLFQFREISKTASARGFEPDLQGCFGVSVNPPEFDQRLPRDYAHGRSLSLSALHCNSL